MKIYFCEKCGVSIPLQEVVAGQATARDGKTYCVACIPKEAQVSADTDSGAGEDLKLYFCDNCGGSIPLQHVITNQAKTVGEKMLCTDCVDLPSPQRAARRDQAEQVRKDKEESRYRLHFCDRCHTSIPQSHIVTGRSIVRGGRTYCERCKGRADRRGPNAIFVISVVAIVLVAAWAGFVLLKAGSNKLFSPPSGERVDPKDRENELRREIAAQLQSDLDSRMEDARLAGEKTRAADEERVADLATTVGKIAGEFDDLKKVADGILDSHAAHKGELDRRLEKVLGSVLLLREDVSALRSRLDELERRPSAGAPPGGDGGPPSVRPRVAPPEPAEPAEPAEEEAPPEVKDWIEQLTDKDAGVRFSAAVELGRAGYPGAAAPLAKILEKDKDTFVRRAAARSLGELNAWEAVPVLIKTLEDREIFVATTAYEALKAITGQDFGFREGLSRSDVRRVVTKARDWWEKHKGDRE